MPQQRREKDREAAADDVSLVARGDEGASGLARGVVGLDGADGVAIRPGLQPVTHAPVGMRDRLRDLEQLRLPAHGGAGELARRVGAAATRRPSLGTRTDQPDRAVCDLDPVISVGPVFGAWRSVFGRQEQPFPLARP